MRLAKVYSRALTRRGNLVPYDVEFNRYGSSPSELGFSFLPFLAMALPFAKGAVTAVASTLVSKAAPKIISTVAPVVSRTASSILNFSLPTIFKAAPKVAGINWGGVIQKAADFTTSVLPSVASIYTVNQQKQIAAQMAQAAAAPQTVQTQFLPSADPSAIIPFIPTYNPGTAPYPTPTPLPLFAGGQLPNWVIPAVAAGGAVLLVTTLARRS